MSAVAEIIARLQGPGTLFSAVSGAADFASIENAPLPPPAAYVMIVEEASGDNERLTGKVLQPSEVDIAVLIVLENLTDTRMGEAAGDIEAAKAFVRNAVIGFEPAGADGPMTHVAGKLIKARHGSVWFEDKFALTTYLEEG